MSIEQLNANGFFLIEGAVQQAELAELTTACDVAFAVDSTTVRARSGGGHVCAARNLLRSVPLVSRFWQTGPLRQMLESVFGERFGLVRVLFFDKPPDRTWSLPWHKDTSIAVKDNSVASRHFSRPTLKAGVPHVVASDEVLGRMLTLRVHLDDVDDENGPLQVVPGSHLSSDIDRDQTAAAVTIHANAGDVLAMRPLISHSSESSKEGTRRHRRILHLEFAADHNLPDAMQWHDLVASDHSEGLTLPVSERKQQAIG